MTAPAKLCPKCQQALTTLPYMCRTCWTALGTRGQQLVYKRHGHWQRKERRAS